MLGGELRRGRSIILARFQIFVKSLDFIMAINDSIEHHQGIPFTQQYHIYEGKHLHDSSLLIDYKICKDSIVCLVLCSHGGVVGSCVSSTS